ncbi:MAG: ComF family protein [Burkholderiales bacterium]|nr:ComF family protein [Burkholderiales bacterium]
MHQPLSISPRGFLNRCLKSAQILVPQSCVLCSGGSSETALCAPCLAALPRLARERCPVCTLPTLSGEVCGACLRHRPKFDRVDCALVYAFPADTLIQALKYDGNLAVAKVLGAVLKASVADRPDLILAMPLSKQRLRERGFNQALEIAKFVARELDIPIAIDSCRKTRDTPPQTALPWKERAKNVRGAFVCDMNLAGKKVAVVDDVMTTGATLNEFAATLRKSGASEVSGWIAARTLPR